MDTLLNSRVVESGTPQADALPAGQVSRAMSLKEWEEYARSKLAAKMEEIRSKHAEYAPIQEPRYDDVFFEAMAAMDEADGTEVPLGRYIRIDEPVTRKHQEANTFGKE
jgi:hypothetical protein